ncbi:MAG: OmpH family outer membrane protein [Rikenellaceae bacterium]|nr:OmpH family outer membrane protein [Rikenellaceae bacterium]MBP3612831.1 OmpH family outer membrane protein [Rikenellaceae bacterium]MBP3682769.1 OmpH family outer membrane protein [Rikenellaceae bacterium]MBQ3254772.1 OmpH family outer membrane protein [Rikenellaceae bacterium]MBQ6691574.1 OmpH family outer membrane protein [Rikenellaceae bacterium]
MKKTLFAAIVAALFAVGCTNNAAQPAEGAAEQATITSSDIAFVKADSLLVMSDIYLTEGVALQKKLEAAQQSWAKKEQGFQYEAAQLQEKYQKGLITTLKAQETEESLNKRVQNYQQSMQKEAAVLDEENFVLQNRINMLVAEAIEEINKDGKYKLILNSSALLDGSQALDITQDLLKIVNEKYAAEKAAAPKAE